MSPPQESVFWHSKTNYKKECVLIWAETEKANGKRRSAGTGEKRNNPGLLEKELKIQKRLGIIQIMGGNNYDKIYTKRRW